MRSRIMLPFFQILKEFLEGFQCGGAPSDATASLVAWDKRERNDPMVVELPVGLEHGIC